MKISILYMQWFKLKETMKKGRVYEKEEDTYLLPLYHTEFLQKESFHIHCPRRISNAWKKGVMNLKLTVIMDLLCLWKSTETNLYTTEEIHGNHPNEMLRFSRCLK